MTPLCEKGTVKYDILSNLLETAQVARDSYYQQLGELSKAGDLVRESWIAVNSNRAWQSAMPQLVTYM